MIKKSILAISGSTRGNSTNLALIKAIEKLFGDQFSFTTFNSIADLPHFNPDLDGERIESVNMFRNLISKADGVLICTPEYAHGVPGSLKNAIDWTVGTGEFHQKPTSLITASTEGKSGHMALLEILRVLEANHLDELSLLIQFVSTKLKGNEIIDQQTLLAVQNVMEKFMNHLNG